MGKLKYILRNNVTGAIKHLSLEYNEKYCMETIIWLI